jgi:hypothetical protein
MPSRRVWFRRRRPAQLNEGRARLRALAELEPNLELLLVHTEQHYAAAMSAVFIDELELPKPDVFLGIGSGTHALDRNRPLGRVAQVETTDAEGRRLLLDAA